MPRRRKYILLRTEIINETYYKRIICLMYNGKEIILQHFTTDCRDTKFYEFYHQWNYNKREEVQAYKHYEQLKKFYFDKVESIPTTF